MVGLERFFPAPSGGRKSRASFPLIMDHAPHQTFTKFTAKLRCVVSESAIAQSSQRRRVRRCVVFGKGTEKPGVGYTRKRGGILCPNSFDRLMQRARICFPVQIDLSSDNEDLGIVRFDGKCAIKTAIVSG